MTTTSNLPAVIEARTPAVCDLSVGTHIRTTVEVHGFEGLGGIIVEHRPEKEIITASGFSFIGLEDFIVAVNLGDGEIVEIALARHEMTAV